MHPSLSFTATSNSVLERAYPGIEHAEERKDEAPVPAADSILMALRGFTIEMRLVSWVVVCGAVAALEMNYVTMLLECPDCSFDL